MKLFYFNPNTYGQEAFVCAESREQAIEFLLATAEDENSPDAFVARNAKWHNDKIKQMIECQNKYKIEEFEPGEVIFSEIC